MHKLDWFYSKKDTRAHQKLLSFFLKIGLIILIVNKKFALLGFGIWIGCFEVILHLHWNIFIYFLTKRLVALTR